MDCLTVLKDAGVLPKTTQSYILTNSEKNMLKDICSLDIHVIECAFTLFDINRIDSDITMFKDGCGYTEKSPKDVYTFIKILGEGGFGIVFEAYSEKMKKNVVVKTYHSDPYFDDYVNAEKSCLNLVKKYCGDKTPCLYEIYNHENNPRLVMEYIDGKNLDDIVYPKIDSSPSSLEIPDNIDRQLISIVKDIHKNGVAHQDIKLENIMLSNDGKIRLVDWGLCCTKNNVKDKLYCGNLGDSYTVPPESSKIYYNMKDYAKIADQPFDSMRAHDIWSIGVVLLDIYSPKKYEYHEFYGLMDKKEIADIINTVEDKKMRNIIKKLLEFDVDKRIKNFQNL